MFGRQSVKSPDVLKKSLFMLLAVAAAANPGSGLAATITIGASKDATIFQNNVNNSSGAGVGLFTGTNGTNSPRRALIDFDIADSLPVGAKIDSVQLTLFLGQVAGSGGGVSGGGTSTATIELHKLTADWGEGITQRQIPPNDNFAGQAQGVAANPNDATWNARFFPTTLWVKPGGDFASAISATATTGTVLNAGTSWGSTPAMVGDVQNWLDVSSSNFGWILVNQDETSATTFRAYYSRDAATTAFHPQLQISYTDAAVLGDINGDGHVTFADIQPMMVALTDLHAYQTSHDLSDAAFLARLDVDQSHTVTNADLQALLGTLKSGGGSGATTVPEPTTLALFAAGGFFGVASSALCRKQI